MSETAVERGLIFGLARVTIEAVTPLTVGTGWGDPFVDAGCVTDANGFPAIPGTSLAGVLRAAWRALEKPPVRERDLFGYQERRKGASSRVEVSWALVHGADDRPVRFLDLDASRDDPVLAFLREGVVRDHVRIDHMGVVDDRGKFDELLVPAGARFTFELLVHGEDGFERLRELLALFASEHLRIGGRTRRGFGRIRLVRAHGRAFDLRREEDRAAFLDLPRDLAEGHGKMPEVAPAEGIELRFADRWRVRVELEPEDGWIVGTGLPAWEAHRRPIGEAIDHLPLTERRIRWRGRRGEVVPDREAEALIPASSIKGALRHRTLFHARRLAGEWARGGEEVAREWRRWAEEQRVRAERGDTAGEPWRDRDRVHRLDPTDEPRDAGALAVELLFGAVKRSADEDGEAGRGRPGCVFLDDVYLARSDVGVALLSHVSLDRFTQGPMDGLLFEEAPLWRRNAPGVRGPRFVVEIDVRRPSSEKERKDGEFGLALRAFRAAVEDLCKGRLALGAGANRGHGYFSGKAEWPDEWPAVGGGR